MKRLIVLCDGTGNSATRCSKELATNVKRFADVLDPVVWQLACDCPGQPRYLGSMSPEAKAAIKRAEETLKAQTGKTSSQPRPQCPKCNEERVKVPQIVYYQSGVGTSTGMGDLSHTWQLGTGAGINDNILDGYHFLANNYMQGDEIFIFGFSRGAFTARVLANLVVQLGLFYKYRLWMMRKAWNQYIKADDKMSFGYFVQQLWEKDAKATRAVTVKVLGVWDTVDSVGAPDYLDNNTWIPRALKGDEFYQPHLVYGIEHCFHALALDEYRRTFNPTLFFLPDPAGKTRPDSKGEYPPIVLRQCWFPGVHSNTGGSYPSEHLADIALAWMIDQCVNHGDLLVFNPYMLERLVSRHLKPGDNKDEYHSGGDEEYPGWGCGTIYDSYGGKKSSLTWQYRTPGNYCISREHRGPSGILQLPEIKLRKLVPFLKSRTPTPSDDVCYDCVHPGRYSKYIEGATNETIHATVFARYKASVEYEKPEKQEQRKALLAKEKRMMKTLNEYTNKGKFWLFRDKTKAVSLLKWNPGALAAFKRDGPLAELDATLARYNREKDPETDAYIWTGRCLKTGKKFYMWEEPDTGSEACGLANPFLQENGEIVYQAKSPRGDMMARLTGEVVKKSVYEKGNLLTAEIEAADDPDQAPTRQETSQMEKKEYLEEGFKKVPPEYIEAERKRREEAKVRPTKQFST